jgi:hypothetical protein
VTDPTWGDPNEPSLYYLDTDTNLIWGLQVEGDWSSYEVVGTMDGTTVTPGVPEGLTAIPGFQLVGLTWTRPGMADLDHYEVRYSPDLAGVPDPDGWTVMQTKSTSIVISPLAADILYWFQVRAVDVNGGVVTSDVDSTVVTAQDNPEAGWADAVSATPTLIGSADMAFNSVVTAFLDTGELSADQIKTGTLSVGAPGQNAQIDVFDAGGALTARWDANGLIIIDPLNPARAIWLASGNMRVSAAFTGDVNTTVWSNSVTAEGINATNITFGVAPGGHNSIPNAGFELTPFAILTSKVWTSAADWATGLSQVNVNVAGTSLTLTTATY